MSESVGRPTFLTVLCFLTFMSSISGLWSQSERLWNPEMTAERTKETFEMVRENIPEQTTAEDTKVMETMFSAVITNTTPETIRTGAIILLIFESMALFGAYYMWNLQKKGFYIYLGGVAVALIAPIILIGGWLGFITAMSGVFLSLFMVLFYALNLKFMQ